MFEIPLTLGGCQNGRKSPHVIFAFSGNEIGRKSPHTRFAFSGITNGRKSPIMFSVSHYSSESELSLSNRSILSRSILNKSKVQAHISHHYQQSPKFRLHYGKSRLLSQGIGSLY